MSVTTHLSFDPDQIELPAGHFIGGSYRPGRPEIEVLRPSDGRLLGTVPDGDDAAIDEAVCAAMAAAKASGWGSMPPRERGRILRRWADLIEADAVRLAQLEAASSTRPVRHAFESDVRTTAETVRFFGELADKIGGDVVATRHDNLGLVVAEPYGVVGAITPWNFPLSMASWKCGPALAAGNAVILKPSELTPFSTLRFAELAVHAGLPGGLFNVVNGRGGTAGAALVRHSDVSKISFTGSTRTGSVILADIAATGVKPITLELGGKSPQLVFEKVTNLKQTAQCIVGGFTSNAGQACVAGTRLIVHRRLAEPLIAAVLAQLDGIRPLPTWDEKASYAPIISQSQSARIQRLVDETCRAGAELLCGGGLFEGTGEGCFYRPTLIGRVDMTMPAVREEVFGPVLTVQVFDDEDEGLALASHPSYGLAAGVHTSDFGQAMRAMRALAAGTVWINRYGRSADMMIPTGGFKQSGIGKDLGRQAVEANLRYKSVLMDFSA